MWDSRFSQSSSQPAVCDFLITQVDLDVSKDRSAFIFRAVRQNIGKYPPNDTASSMRRMEFSQSTNFEMSFLTNTDYSAYVVQHNFRPEMLVVQQNLSIIVKP